MSHGADRCTTGSLIWSSAGELWFTTGLDEDNQCQTCLSSIGVLDASGRFEVMSHLTSPLAPNEYMPQIEKGPDGAMYVARTMPSQIVRVLR